MNWRESPTGQHIELGIAEGNLAGLLGELGATWSRWGETLLPIGTIYDPFVTRALEQWSFGMYSGGQSILVGTPSGVTLAPEGGAHQSIITPSIGVEQPQCVAWEPCFAQDLEWTMLHALGQPGHADGRRLTFDSAPGRSTSRLPPIPTDPASGSGAGPALAGGYPLRRSPGPRLTLVGTGAVMPEVLAAADRLAARVDVDVVCLTSADLVFRALQSRQGLVPRRRRILGVLFPARAIADRHRVRRAPAHAVVPGWGQRHPIANLGVDDFGQVGDIDDLYRHFGIDTDTIIGAAWDLIEGPVDGSDGGVGG